MVKVSSAPFDEYVVGTLKPGVNDSFAKVAGASDIGAAIPAGQLIDSGNIYASKSFFDSVGKRRILFGWVHEEPGFPATQNWQGVQSIPRHVVLDPRNESRLLFTPIDEVASLREPSPVAVNRSLCAGCAVRVLSDSGNKLDVLLRVKRAHAADALNLTLVLLANEARTEGINVSLTLTPQDAQPLNNAALFVNGTNTSKQWATHPCAQGRQPGTPFVYCACFPNCGNRFTVYPDEYELTLRALLDVSILEVFAQGGRARPPTIPRLGLCGAHS